MRKKTGVVLVVITAGMLYGASQFRIADWMQNEPIAPASQTPLAPVSLLSFPNASPPDAAADRVAFPAAWPAPATSPRQPASAGATRSAVASPTRTASAALEDIFAELRRRDPVYAGQVKDYLGVSRETISLEDLQTKAPLLMERRRRLYENPEASGRVIEGFLQASRDVRSLDAERGMAMSVLVALPAADRAGLRAEITADVRSKTTAQTEDPSYLPQAIRAYIQNSGDGAAHAREAFLAAIGPVEEPAVRARIDELFKQQAGR